MQIDWWTLALQAVNFLVLVWLLWRFLFRPVKRVIEERKKLADEAFEKAAKKESEAETARARYEEREAALADERQEMLKRLHQELEDERAKVLEDAEQDAARLREEAGATIHKEREAALKALRQEVVDLAADMAEKLLKHSAAQPSGPALLKLIETHLAKLDEEELRRLRDDLEPQDARLLVVTAQQLSPESETGIRTSLAGQLGHEGRIDFSLEPELLGGLELRFPHNVISFAWADQLRQMKERIEDDEESS